MPYDSNNPGGGGEDLYADAAPPADKTSKSEESGDQGITALLPKNICPGMEPGDEMVLKIVRVTDDQYEVAYAPEPKDSEEEKEPAAEMPSSAAKSEEGMASMMED